MKKLVTLALFIFIALSLLACSGAGTTPTPKVAPTLPAIKQTNKVVAEGKVVPVKSAVLSFQVAGTITQVNAALGDKVDAGKTLALLDTKALEIQIAQADANLAAAQAKLDQLKVGVRAEDVSAAQQALKSAQAAYENLLRPSDNEMIALKSDIDKAKAQVDRAQAAYDRVGGDSNPFATMTAERAALQTAWLDYQKALALYNSKLNPTNAQIQQALSAIEAAKNTVAKLTPTKEDLAAADANVKAAKAARDLAADTLARAKLTAPFAGTLVVFDVKAGEVVAVGTPVARLADTTTFQIETTDLTEINIVNVKEGDPVAIALDAIPGLELAGKVASIKGFGENKSGDIVYTVTVNLDKQDERLKWNMTAKVTIAK